MAKQEQEGNGEGVGTIVDGSTIVNSSDFAPVFERNETLTKIEVNIPISGIWILYGAGTGIIFLSVLAAGLPVMRMKPREILALMS